MIRLSCTLPATPDELSALVDAARHLGVTSIDHDAFELIADISTRPPAPPDPSSPSAPPAATTTKRAPAKKAAPARKAAAKKQASAPVQAGAIEAAITRTLRSADGRWDGSASSLAAKAWSANLGAAKQTVSRMERSGKLRLVRQGRMVKAIILVGHQAATPAAAPTPAPAQRPASPPAPAPVPAGGIPTPPGGFR